MYKIYIQYAADAGYIPDKPQLRRWAKQALAYQAPDNHFPDAEITIRIASLNEMTELNSLYRHKTGPTNVLSFPFTPPEEVDIDLAVPILGDIVICPDVVNKEAAEQGKSPESHWAHMVIHGIFHLRGFDHENEAEAEIMEAHEINTLQSLGFANPYTGTHYV